MRICVDIQAAVSQRAGVGRYTRSLVEHLGPIASADDSVNLFFFDFRRRGLDFTCPGATPSPVRWVPGKYVQQAWKRLHWPPFGWFAGKADLYHFPNFTIPPLATGKAVVTIHDMSFARYPEFAEQKNLDYLQRVIRRTVERADAILAVSRFSKQEIETCLDVSPAKVFAIPLGIASTYGRPSPAALADMRRQLNLDRPYLLTVGTIEPRKNLTFMMDVFDQLKGFDGDLVIAGRPGWKFEPILARMLRSPKRDRIRHLPDIGDAQLPGLYAGAELFLITSRYEGFGFPPLEAMACGTAVVASTGGSLPEILGDTALLVPGFETGSWVEALETLLQDNARRAAMAARGPGHAARYTWTETARQTWEVYRKVLS